MKYNYYGIKGDYVWHLLAGTPPNETRWLSPKLFEQSDVVWYQGPRGGVRIVYIRDWADKYQYGYIKQNSEAMKEFAWIKLKARSLNTKLWSQV
jgi:hypothetical protein